MAKKAKITGCPVCGRLIAIRGGTLYRHKSYRQPQMICSGSGQTLRVLREMGVRDV